MRKKLICLILIATLGISLMFIGCGNSMAKKSLQQAKVSIENKDYNKAVSLLEITLDEDSKNEEAKKLYNIVEGYENANKAYEENNMEKAKKILDSINGDYINYPIKTDIDNLKTKVDKQNNEVEKVNTYLHEAKTLYNDKKYGECKTFLVNNILGSSEHNIDVNKYATQDQKKKALELLEKCNTVIVEREDKKETQQSKKANEEKENQQIKGTKAEYLSKLNDIQASMGDLKELSDTGVTANMNTAAATELKRWDDILNEIYALLKVQLPANEMEDLKNKQINWIKYRDKTADNEANKFEGGSFASVQYNITLARLTKERCYQLVNTYMK